MCEAGRRWSLFCMYFLSLTTSASVSVMSPFFPTEAAKKGVSPSTAGYVFSIYGLTLIIMNAIVGKVLPIMGNKVGLSIGILLLGPTNIIFGLLDNISDVNYFTLLCFVIRVIEAIGAAFVSTTVFTTIMKLCPQNFAKEVAMNEACVSAGFMFGPVLGSSLYAIGGYSLPFVTLGAAVLINLLFSLFLIKQYKKEVSSESETCLNHNQLSISYKKLISIFDIWLFCVINLMCSINFGAFEVTFGLQLQTYGVGPKLSGLLYFIPSAAYGFGSVVVGNLYTKNNRDTYFMIGLCTSTLGFLLIGPFSLFPSTRNIYFLMFSLVVLGLGVACAMIPTLPSMMNIVTERGFSESITTCSRVSGLWTTVYSAGYVIGPSLGAVIYEKFGYANLMTVISFMNLFVVSYAVISISDLTH